MKEVKTIAIDLAKNIFQLHGADRWGRTVGNRVRLGGRSLLADAIGAWRANGSH